jgi:hypothetical protein
MALRTKTGSRIKIGIIKRPPFGAERKHSAINNLSVLTCSSEEGWRFNFPYQRFEALQ